MASFQVCYKWMVTWSAVMAVVTLVSCCHPSSRELHICVNIYLERDFPYIETIVEGLQQNRPGRGRIIIEGPDLSNICSRISSLIECYSPLVRECDTLWQLDRFERARGVLQATRHHLCGNGTKNVRDLLENSACLGIAKTHISNCTGFNWWLTWREVLRMQVSSSERCMALKTYRRCFQRSLSQVVCGKEASRVYLALIDVWLKSWCGMYSIPAEDKNYLYYALNADWSAALKQPLSYSGH